MKKQKRPIVAIHTDGSYKGSPKCGGYAGVMVSGNHAMTIIGRDENAPDNDRMELQAVVSCLRQVDVPAKIHISSDSQYVVKGINTWMRDWENNEWRTKSGRPCANKELWQELSELRKEHMVHAEWVKGHLDNPSSQDEIANQVCDDLAQKAADGRINLTGEIVNS